MVLPDEHGMERIKKLRPMSNRSKKMGSRPRSHRSNDSARSKSESVSENWPVMTFQDNIVLKDFLKIVEHQISPQKFRIDLH